MHFLIHPRTWKFLELHTGCFTNLPTNSSDLSFPEFPRPTLQFRETAMPCQDPYNLVRAGAKCVDMKARIVRGCEEGCREPGNPSLEMSASQWLKIPSSCILSASQLFTLQAA